MNLNLAVFRRVHVRVVEVGAPQPGPDPFVIPVRIVEVLTSDDLVAVDLRDEKPLEAHDRVHLERGQRLVATVVDDNLLALALCKFPLYVLRRQVSPEDCRFGEVVRVCQQEVIPVDQEDLAGASECRFVGEDL